MEIILSIFLLIAVGYIIYLESLPKTDKERKRNEEMRERMVITKQIQAEKDKRRTQKD